MESHPQINEPDDELHPPETLGVHVVVLAASKHGIDDIGVSTVVATAAMQLQQQQPGHLHDICYAAAPTVVPPPARHQLHG